MTELDDLPFGEPLTKANPAASPRKCRRHGPWIVTNAVTSCLRCGHIQDPAASRRGRNNRKRGGKAELDVARQVNGNKMGPLGLPWDVEVEGYMRLQVKKLASWPSLKVIQSWIDAIPPSVAMRGVALIEAAGAGRRGRRLLVLDLDEYREHHGDILRQEDADIQPIDPYLADKEAETSHE